MITNKLGLDIFLLERIDGGDVFVHGAKLEKTDLDLFANSVFNEGLKKVKQRSILSTIALKPDEKDSAEFISGYIGRGNARVVIHIPEELDDLFFGKCKQCYGDSGNQYSKNSVLDFLELDAIPPEFIVGIVYSEGEISEIKNPNTEYQIIENPIYFSHDKYKDENRKQLIKKITQMVQDGNDGIVSYIIQGDTSRFDPTNPKDMELLREYGLEEYKDFIEQRVYFDKAKQEESIIFGRD